MIRVAHSVCSVCSVCCVHHVGKAISNANSKNNNNNNLGYDWMHRKTMQTLKIRPVVRSLNPRTHIRTHNLYKLYDDDDNNNNAPSDQYLRTHKMRFVFATSDAIDKIYEAGEYAPASIAHEKMIRMIRKFVRCAENTTVRGKSYCKCIIRCKTRFAIRIALATSNDIANIQYYEENTIREYK